MSDRYASAGWRRAGGSAIYYCSQHACASRGNYRAWQHGKCDFRTQGGRFRLPAQASCADPVARLGQCRTEATATISRRAERRANVAGTLPGHGEGARPDRPGGS